MNRAICLLAATACASLGLVAMANAAPLPGLTVNPAAQAAPLVSNVTWMNVCRDQTAVRRDVRGRMVLVQVPRCNMVWVGKRYINNGVYYADPNFMLPL